MIRSLRNGENDIPTRLGLDVSVVEFPLRGRHVRLHTSDCVQAVPKD